MFLCLLRREHYVENFTFTCLNNLENNSKKTAEKLKLTSFLCGCLFVYTFCQFLQVDSYLRTKNLTDTRQSARFRVHRHDFTSQVAGPSEDRARNGNKSTLVSLHFFTSCYPKKLIITTDKALNGSKMHFLRVKVVKSDAQ